MPPPPIGYPPGHANHAEADRYTNAAALRVLDGTPIRRITVGPGSVPQEHNARSGGDVQPVSVASLLVLCRIVPNPQPKPLEGSPQTVLELVKLLLWPM
ncbi:hypothetical protein PF007_g26133 [Phytophthora fragariae]|uniref:Uncharacterized protein n=1 Tax=Phytophthora fragariae TaxID=53985 RepID=A0A6A3QAY1_9STRA|nr:hypothetical protein PF007_g26133 [Phytophthora fragariae]KAE9272704.1 hypothetical protein PF001_g27824 [Phytophthora fragariae]